VLRALVASAPGDAAVVERAVAWLDANPGHPQAHEVLRALVASSAGDAAVVDRAVACLDANPEHPQAYCLLEALVANNPENAAVVERAVAWVHANSHHSKAYQLLAVLVARSAADERVAALADGWLASNRDHRQYQYLLGTMIVRTDGAERWLRLGEEYVRQPDALQRQQVLGVLVTGGKAAPKYVEMALDYLDCLAGPATEKYRKFVLYHLCRALARNPANAAEYLSGPFPEGRKRLVAAHWVWGLKGLPDYLAALADTAFDKLDPARAAWMLRRLVERQVTGDRLDDMLVAWLDANYRSPGYGKLLRALAARPGQWAAVADRLPAEVVADFEDWSSD